MIKSKVKIGMKVIMTEDYCSLKKGEIYEVLYNQGNGKNSKWGIKFESDYFVLNHSGAQSFLAPSHKQFKPI